MSNLSIGPLYVIDLPDRGVPFWTGTLALAPVDVTVRSLTAPIPFCLGFTPRCVGPADGLEKVDAA